MTEPQIQFLDGLGAEFARVAPDEERSPRRSLHRVLAPRPHRALAVGLGVLALLGGAAFAVPPTRAGIEDITSTFAGWVGGDGDQAPGRALRPDDDAPHWVRQSGGSTRLIAEAAGVGLYVTRTETKDGTMLHFSLGAGVGFGDSIEGWRERFDQHAVFVLGPTLFGPQDILDDRGRFPLLGVTARSVERVELRYVDGPPLIATGVNGGFVLIADAWRPFRELVAYDAAGRILERADVSQLDMRYLCEKEPECPSP